MHAKCCLSFFLSVGVHFNTFFVFSVDKLHGLTVGKCRMKPSLQQVSAIPAMVRTSRLAARLFALYVHEPNGKKPIHGLLYQEDGTLSLSRHVKACRVGQFHGEMFNI